MVLCTADEVDSASSSALMAASWKHILKVGFGDHPAFREKGEVQYTCAYTRAVLCWDKSALWGDRCYLCFNLQQSDSVGEAAVCCTVNGITINPGNRFTYPVCGTFFHPSLPSVNCSQPSDGVCLLDRLGKCCYPSRWPQCTKAHWAE